MEPDRETTGHTQLIERTTPGAAVFMGRMVSRFSQAVEYIPHLAVEDITPFQAVKDFVEAVFTGTIVTGMGRDMLREGLCELPELDEGRVGIVEDISFGPGDVLKEQGIIFREESEIG
jgi:hypothetical protein